MRTSPWSLALLVVATGCATPRPVVVEAPPPAEEGPFPMSLDPRFACGPDRLRRGEAEEAARRAQQSLDEVRRARGDADPAAARLKDDLATALRNRDEADHATADCEESVLAQRADRVARAETRPVRELRAIAADERLEKEAARVQADDARMQVLLRDEPAKVMLPLLSALYCVTGGARQPLADELAGLAPALKKKGKAGAAAKARARELQPKIAQADALLESLRQELSALGTAVPCEDPANDRLQECLAGKAGGEHRPECDDPASADVVSAWDYFGVGERQAERFATSL